ncbi:MAG TPA: GDP-mannose 4,6-dehydratase, partial [Bacteroidia bacterium]|nr:GDP-mannose 4,6-dehydratase [Bacteroidia bacterium]
TCVRDYIHVVDIARAHIAAMERLIQRKNKTPFEIYNLGTGTGFTVLQTIQAFEKVTGKPLNYTLGPRRPGDVEKVWADTTLVSKELGWKAEFGIEEIMRSAWAWELRLQEESKKQLA